MYHNLNTLTIFPEKLVHNFRVLSEIQSGIVVTPVVKSNAYGHGIKMLAPLLNRYSCTICLCRFSLRSLRARKTRLQKGYPHHGVCRPEGYPTAAKFYLRGTPTLEYAQAVLRTYSKARLHLFLDTGMHQRGDSISRYCICSGNTSEHRTTYRSEPCHISPRLIMH
jgi:alanine racemase